jgi:hypothetical protein
MEIVSAPPLLYTLLCISYRYERCGHKKKEEGEKEGKKRRAYLGAGCSPSEFTTSPIHAAN